MCTLHSKYYCYGGYTGWVVLDMITLSFQLFPALNPNFICNGMATDHITRSVICTSLGQTTSWCSCARACAMLRARACSRCSACRSQLVSLPASELGNTSASPRVIIDDLVSVCGFGANEQARDLEYDSHTAMVYINTQQCVKPHHQN